MPTLNAVVSGHVQGVGYRDFVRLTARRAGITGEVWNRFDGVVEVIAFHSEQAVLESFVRNLAAGPGFPEAVEHTYLPTIGNYETFSVGPSR